MNASRSLFHTALALNATQTLSYLLSTGDLLSSEHLPSTDDLPSADDLNFLGASLLLHQPLRCVMNPNHRVVLAYLWASL